MDPRKLVSRTLVLTSLIGLAFTACGQAEQEDVREGAWKGVPLEKRHTDHSTFMNEPFADGPSVTKACLECHEEAGQEMLKTAHWQWQGEEVIVPGHDKPTRIGKKNVINNFCIGVQSNWPSCTTCHVGYGWKDETFDFNNPNNIDCLVCHDQTGTYRKKGKTGGMPEPDVDLLAAARSVGRPGRANCGTCHFRGGGGNAVKHGDMDNTMLNPVERVDVHMGRYNLVCVDCHKTENHAIRGRSISVSVNDEHGVACTDCHDAKPHADSRLNSHVNRVACQACHIPEFAVEEPTKMTWDWGQAGQDLDIKDKHVYMKIKGRFTYGHRVKPEYYWFNGTSTRYMQGDKMDPKKPTKIAQPLGKRMDPKSKLWPFKVHRGKQPYDKVNKIFLVPNVAGPEGYWTKFDWDLALKNGSKVTGLPYSGEYGFAPTEMYWPLSHMVSPKENALSCGDCHGNEGRLDWKALGYKADPIGLKQVDADFEHDAIVFKDADGNPVSLKAKEPEPTEDKAEGDDAAEAPTAKPATGSHKPISMKETCSECHELDDADFLAKHPYHAHLDMASLLPERQQLMANGPRFDGEAEVNCLVCHLKGADMKSRLAEIKAGKTDWSVTATLGHTDLVKVEGGKVTYNDDAFDDGEAEVPLGPATAEGCGNCHGVVAKGHEDVSYAPLKNRDANGTQMTGQIFSGQRIRLSNMNIVGKDDLSRPWDIHTQRLVTCTECHYAKGVPERFAKSDKGAEYKDGERRRCETCHAAKETHLWLSEKDSHFKNLACESCHIPKLYAPAVESIDRTVLTLAAEPAVTYRGLAEGASVHDELPYVAGYEPALLNNFRGGKVGPNNLVTTWQWIHGDKSEAVPASVLAEVYLNGGAYRPEILTALDTNKDGALSDAELRLDNAAKVSVIAKALEAKGFAKARIDGEVRALPIHHDIGFGRWARRECTDCHTTKGKSDLKARSEFKLAPFMPGGVEPRVDATKLGGTVVKATDGSVSFRPEIHKVSATTTAAPAPAETPAAH